MKKYKWVIIILNLLLLLAYFNYSVGKKEELLKEGELVLLELAPVDPRSLMQGDYMDLRYSISEISSTTQIPKRGYCVVRVDNRRVANRVRFQQKERPLHHGEQLIEYSTTNGWNINIGAESFFFQEGEAKKYDKARYGGLKINKMGRSLLVGLYDESRKLIE